MLNRITKFIPKSEYMKLYDALFKSHLSYCIIIIIIIIMVVGEEFQSINYKMHFQRRKDVYVFYSVKLFI